MSNCTTCGTCKEDCQCIPTGMTTPPSCPNDLPPCPQPNPCNETFDSKCVIYTGEDIPCFSIETGNSVEEVITNMTSLLQPLLCLNCTIINFPANDATQVPVNQILSWNIVPGATSYDVYFGTTPVTPPLVSIGQISTAYTPPAPLVPNTDYYWKIVPKNSAGSAQNCPTYHFKTTELLCVNPMSYFLEHILADQTDPTIVVSDLINSINTYLDNGELITNCNFCCPDCTETDRYVLATAPLYALYYSEFYNLPNCPPVCCAEVDASLTAMATQFNLQTPSLVTAFANVPPVTNCCGTNFSECAASLKTALTTFVSQVFQLYGVVEESTISNSTTLCILANFLNDLPGNITPTEKADIINAILFKGFVVQCRPEGTIISGYLAYKTYINNVQEGCLCYVPC